ncbi:AAA family ATPase [Conexibacter woesei]|uniref:AAA family ATPase n=1 Tax=Conexibacter woesei TaxID=191495 RepID=UPI00040843E0|nr:LuxR family transcriptional regulator [Conexibacter woesei]
MQSLSPHGAAAPLVGRDAELSLLRAALDHAPSHGSALVLRGEAGIGKSVLLDAARAAAHARDLTVLATAGVEAESSLPYAGLQRLLLPLLPRVDALPAPQRSVLLAALGAEDQEGGDLFLVALAALGLLALAAADGPLLVLIDDLHWLDDASHDVMTFIARRVDADPIVLLAAVRDGAAARGGDLGIPVHTLSGLEVGAARALLDARAPGLPAAVRRRLLHDAAGNPLALVELPAPATARAAGMAADEAILPVSERLERTFARRVDELPAETAAALLVFAADAAAPLADVLTAADALLRDEAPAERRVVTVAALQPAIDAGLVRLEGTTLRFRHPLVRSAIYQAAPVARRQAAHAALTALLDGQPDRRAWHRSAAATGPDEAVAADVEALAQRALRRGAILQAATALARAAELSEADVPRVRRILAAAELAFELGRAEMVRALVAQAERLALSDHDEARVAWLSEIFHDGAGHDQGDAPRVLHLVALAQRAAREDDPDLALHLLGGAALRCWWGGSVPAVRRKVVAAAEAVGVAAADPRRLAAIAMAEPLTRAAEVMAAIRAAVPLVARDPLAAFQHGTAAHALGDYEASLRLLAGASDGLREQGRLGLLAQASVMRAIGAIQMGDWAVASTSASEGVRLAAETDQPIWRSGATGALAALAGLRGERAEAEALHDEAELILGRTGSGAVLGWLRAARALTALSAGEHEEAYAIVARMFDPDDASYHLRDQYMGVAVLADAAAGCGRQAEARAIVDGLRDLARATPAVGVQMGLRYAVPVLAEGEVEAEAAFMMALDEPWATRPFERARLLLAHGMWLRRRRRLVESREPLRDARHGFDASHTATWAERARQELRAAGGEMAPRTVPARDTLSPQELEIAQLAAEGLSNREIGQRLYLSHRTVGSHLYRVFPKLGITSRTQLPGVLERAAVSRRPAATGRPAPGVS